jgi:hypothetical protein
VDLQPIEFSRYLRAVAGYKRERMIEMDRTRFIQPVRVSGFVKIEQMKVDVKGGQSYLMTDLHVDGPLAAHLDSYKNPRLICSPNVSLQYVMGPLTNAIADRLKCNLRLEKQMAPIRLIIGQGLNAEELGQQAQACEAWVAEAGGVVRLESDLKECDSHFLWPIHLRLWQLLFIALHIFSIEHNVVFDDIRDAIAYLAKSNLRSAHGLLAIIKTVMGMMSGRPDTSMLTTLMNLLINYFAAMPMSKNLDFRMAHIAMGDDGGTWLVEKYSVKTIIILHKAFKAMEMILETNIRDRLCDFEFCSGLFWPVNGRWVFGPKPGRLLARTFITKKLLAPSRKGDNHNRHLRIVAMGLEKQVAFIPVLRVVVSTILEQTHPSKPGMFFTKFRHHVMIYNREERQEQVIKPSAAFKMEEDTLRFFCERYGVVESEVLDFENFMAKVDYTKASVLTHPFAEMLVRCDYG